MVNVFLIVTTSLTLITCRYVTSTTHYTLYDFALFPSRSWYSFTDPGGMGAAADFNF